MNKPFLFFIAFFLITSQAHSQATGFLKNMRSYCGNSYGGKAIFPEGDKNPFAGKELKIIFETCKKKEVRIPFHVGEDKSRTWVLTTDKQGLLFKHDHRHEDGTPDEVTNYGGYAAAGGTALQQSFPADEFTAKLLPAAATNEWTFVLDEENGVLSYILKRDGQLRFQADFDLKNPLPSKAGS